MTDIHNLINCKKSVLVRVSSPCFRKSWKKCQSNVQVMPTTNILICPFNGVSYKKTILHPSFVQVVQKLP